MRDASGFTLTEGDSFRVGVGETFTVPANPGKLSFSYDHLSFDTTDDFVNDAFEVSLLNPTTNEPLVPAFAQGRDAFLNITEGVGMAVGAGTTAQSTAPAPLGEGPASRPLHVWGRAPRPFGRGAAEPSSPFWCAKFASRFLGR